MLIFQSVDVFVEACDCNIVTRVRTKHLSRVERTDAENGDGHIGAEEKDYSYEISSRQNVEPIHSVVAGGLPPSTYHSAAPWVRISVL